MAAPVPPSRPRPKPGPGPTGHALARISVASVARLSFWLYASLVGFLLGLGIVLYVLGNLFGAVSGVEHWIQSLFGFTSFRFLPLEMLLGAAVTGAVLTGLGTLANVVGALIYNRLARSRVGAIEVMLVPLDSPRI